MPPKISVLVTCYNHEKYIEECLRSIFAQTHKNIELLVFNDGSTDKSGEIIESVLKKSPFAETYYFSGENQGLAFVRNEALFKAKGSFLLFVDSDNWLPENYLAVLLAKLEETNADIAYCQLWDFENQRDLLPGSLTYSLEQQMEGNRIDSCSLFRRSALGQTTFDKDLKRLEDYDFWLRLILDNHAQPVFVQGTKLNYRVLEDSRSQHGDWTCHYETYFQVLQKHIQKHETLVLAAFKKNMLNWVEGYHHAHNQSQKLSSEKAEQEVKISGLQARVQELTGELQDLYASRSFKLGYKILHPFRKFKL